MALENKLGLTNQVALAKHEEKISKQKAKDLYDSGKMNKIEIGTFKGLSDIHRYLFSDIYAFTKRCAMSTWQKGISVSHQ